METFCTTSRHSKYRPTLNSNSFYQASTYSRNFRQNEYCFANSARNSTLLWHERPHPTVVKSKGKYCSIALAVSASVVLLAVISIVGLALHIGALKNEPSNALMSYSCSAKVARGDRFATNLSEKARRYRIQLESLYQSSILGPALVSCTVEKFGNDSLTIYFKINLSRKKIPKQIHNIEKTIKDILLNDALSKKSVFQFVRFEPRSVTVKQMMDFESYQRVITKPKELPKARATLKLPNKTQITLTTGLPVKKKAVIEEIDIKEEDLPVIQGSFKISKTEADITEKKSNRTLETSTQKTTSIQKTSTQKTTTQMPRRPTLKETSVTSALFKLASTEKATKPPTTITTTSTPIPSQITTTTTSTTHTTEFLSTKQAQINPVLFSVSPSIFNQEPWVPIYHLPKETYSEVSPVQPTQQKEIKSNQPVYTSFTNPGLSFHSLDSEKLGSTKLKGHPIPVKKIPDITESFIWETTTEIQHTTIPPILEVTTYDPHIKSDSIETDRNNAKLQQSAVLKNISSIFHSLASSLGIAPIYFQGVKKTLPQNIEITTKIVTEEPVTTTRWVEEEVIKNIEVTKEPVSGEGLAEVVDIDESSLILHTTNVPLVTLLPVKSNSGVGRPIRPRPETRNETVSGNRSFPSDSSKLNVNTDEFTKNPIKYVETEVVTSISSKLNKVKVDKSQSNYKIVSVLNFETEAAPTREHEPTPTSAIIFNKEVEAPVYDHQISFLNTNFTPPIDKSDFYLSPEKLSQLSEISKLSDNNTNDAVISTKAVSSSYTINHSGFKILTKTYNKIPSSNKDVANKSSGVYNTFYIDITNKSECSNFTVKCGDGTCLPETTRCNQLVDCNDGSDEKDCNCADYLRSQFLLRKICDGIVDCWDFSDENHCDWCSPGQYVCGNSKSCINRTNICDGVRDCPLGDDERQCVTVAPNLNAADEFPYYSEGYLLIRKHGRWGKLCVDNFNDVMSKSKTSWEISDLGQAVCKAMTYQSLDTVKIFLENKSKSVFKSSHYFELTYSHRNESKSSLTFENTTCSSGEVVKVKCNSLECGARPQVSKQLSRIVGGGNAGLGAWPWQAALYKEGEFQCGATLISDKWLMSAGHCFYHSLDEHWVARLGALRRGTSLPSPYEQLRPIAQIILHPNYVDNGFINDISLLKMQTAVTFSDYVRPICLPPAGVAPKDGRICTVIGWGQLFEIGRIFPDTLQEVQVPVISTAECRKRTLFLPLYRVTDDMFCAGYDRGGRDACLGDSGGPLMCPESDGRWVLHGITSNGYGCARAYRPGVYTKVSNYITWINTHLYKLDNNSAAVKDSCAGHRCPLGECLPKSNLCNGFIECSDGSDEVECLNN